MVHRQERCQWIRRTCNSALTLSRKGHSLDDTMWISYARACQPQHLTNTCVHPPAHTFKSLRYSSNQWQTNCLSLSDLSPEVALT